MQYYNSYTDSYGFVHSIDMVYCEYMSFFSPGPLLEKLQAFHSDFPDVEYAEFLNRPCHSKYSYYLDAVRFDGVFIEFGKYNNYDKVSGTFDLIPMFQIRFNPNKYMHLDWFRALLLLVLDCGSSGSLRNYDYAIDIPVALSAVQLFDCRREKGLYKGTRYYGQSGRHGYVKVYDKYKDLFRKGEVVNAPLTRVEQTIFSSQPLHLEPIYVMDQKLLDDFSDLKETERAIVEMYSILAANHISYDLTLGRKMHNKLRPYLFGGYRKVEYADILELLLANIHKILKVDLIYVDENGFFQVDENDPLPFD